MYLLYEAASGLAMFKVFDEGRLKAADLVGAMMRTSTDVQKIVSLVSFHSYSDVEKGLANQTSSFEKAVGDELKDFVKATFVDAVGKKDSADKLLVQDPHLVTALKDVCGIRATFNDVVVELSRGIRAHLASLVPGFDPDRENSMAMGLAHSFSRYRIKFNADSIDIMLIQAIALVDDTEKDINQFAMRLREWMVWHFPELINIVQDNIDYARTVVVLKNRRYMEEILLTSKREKFIDELNKVSRDQSHAIISAANISVGTDITDQDSDRIVQLANELLSLVAYREELHQYIEARMLAVAPNFTNIVGPIVGVRLLAKAGGLLNLAKIPASTLQILGSERALFRAMKMRSKQTPKYGFIYHAALVGKASVPNRGKMARVVATSASLAARVDALSEIKNTTFAQGKLDRINSSLRFYEGDKQARANRKSVASQKMEAYRRGNTTGYEGKGDMKLAKEKVSKHTDANANVSAKESEGTKKPVEQKQPEKTRMSEAFEDETGFAPASESAKTSKHSDEPAQSATTPETRSDETKVKDKKDKEKKGKKDKKDKKESHDGVDEGKESKEGKEHKSKEHKSKSKDKDKDKDKDKERHKDKSKDKEHKKDKGSDGSKKHKE